MPAIGSWYTSNCPVVYGEGTCNNLLEIDDSVGWICPGVVTPHVNEERQYVIGRGYELLDTPGYGSWYERMQISATSTFTKTQGCNGAIARNAAIYRKCLYNTLTPTKSPTSEPTIDPTSVPTTASPTIDISDESLWDFKMYRYDDNQSIASNAGYKLVSLSEIKSGPIHDAFTNFMNEKGNRIQSLGTWNIGGTGNCLYSTAAGCNVTISDDINTCNATKSLAVNLTYHLCLDGRTVQQALQALASAVVSSSDAAAIYVKSVSCMFGIYDHTDSDGTAASNGWSIMYYADFQSNSTYRQLFLDYYIQMNHHMPAIGSWSTTDCAMVYGESTTSYALEIDNSMGWLCPGVVTPYEDARWSYIAGVPYTLLDRPGFDVWYQQMVVSQSSAFKRITLSSLSKNAAIYRKCLFNTPTPSTSPLTSNPTTSPTIDLTNLPTNNPTMEPTSDPTIEPTKFPSFFPTNLPTNSSVTNDPSSAPSTPPTQNPIVTTYTVDISISFEYEQNQNVTNLEMRNILANITNLIIKSHINGEDNCVASNDYQVKVVLTNGKAIINGSIITCDERSTSTLHAAFKDTLQTDFIESTDKLQILSVKEDTIKLSVTQIGLGEAIETTQDTYTGTPQQQNLEDFMLFIIIGVIAFLLAIIMALFIVWKKKREKWQKDRSVMMSDSEVQMGERNVVVAPTSPTTGEDNEPGINSNFSHTVDDNEDMYGTTKITAGEDNDSTDSTDDEKHEQLYDKNQKGTTAGYDEDENAPTEIVYASEDDDMYDNENTKGQTIGKDPTSDVGTPTINFHQSTHL